MKRLQPPPRRLVAAVLMTALAAVWPAGATTYVRMSDEALFDRSPYVIEGRVVSVAPVTGQDLPAIDYLVHVERRIKGFLPGSSLVVRVPGGVRPDGVGLRIRGAPRFDEGDEALLFLTPRRDGTFALHQLMLGAFYVEWAGSKRVAFRRLDGAVELVGAGRAPAADGVRDLDAFRLWMSDRRQGLKRAADYVVSTEEWGSEHDLLHKFAITTSTREPPPLGCGEGGGHGVRWFSDLNPWPVTWRYHVSGQEGLDFGGLTDFQHAVESWGDDPHTPVRYLYLGRTRVTNGFLRQDNVNAVIFEDPNDEIGGSFVDSGVLAIGGPWFLCDVDFYAGEEFHPIIEADIVVQDGVREFFDALGDPSSAAQELFAHELGHTLGLSHSLHREALMRGAIHADGRGASHDVDDLAAAYFLYGRPAVPTDNDGPPVPRVKPPAAPSELAAAVREFTEVELTWTDESDDESNFRIERRRGGDVNFRFVATVPSGRDTYTDSVAPETVYTYRVMAQNGAGRSPPSELVRVTTPEDLRPMAPTNLRTAAVSRSRVRLSWQDNSDDETSFVIELQRQNAWLEVPFSVPSGTNVVELLGLTSGLTFNFRVSARNAHGDSGPSNESASTLFTSDVSCLSTAYQLCARNGRFIVELYYQDPAGGTERPATVDPVTDDSSLFWFFEPANPELVVRLFDEPGGETQIAFAGMTHLGYRLRVTDTLTGDVRELVRAAGGSCEPVADTFFAIPGSELDRNGNETAPCPGDEETLCALDGRFVAELTWFDAGDSAAPRRALAMTRLGSSGFFSFDSSGQVDVVFKLLDGRAWNGSYWVYASASIPAVSYELTVTDTLTGVRRTYAHTAGAGCGVADTSAFADLP